MPDIVIDYELLNRLGKETDTIKHKISDARTQHHSYSPDEVGSQDVSFALEMYYSAWSSAFKHAWNVLESLSNTYTSVAQQWFDQDASYAATANEQAAGFQHSLWAMKKADYDNWVKLSHTYVTSHTYDDNGNMHEVQVPLADPKQPPPDPGPEPTTFSVTNPDGSQQNTTSTYDSSGNLTSNDTTITDGAGGMTYHEHTAFGDNGSYTSVVTNADGSKVTDTVTGNPDGTGTRTVTTTDSQGQTTTTTYSGTGVNGNDPTWTQTGGGGNGNRGGGGNGSSGTGSHSDPYNHGPKIN